MASSPNSLNDCVGTHLVEGQVAPSHCSQSCRCPLTRRPSHPVEVHTDTLSPWSVWKDRSPPRIANRHAFAPAANFQVIHIPSIRRHCSPYCGRSRHPPAYHTSMLSFVWRTVKLTLRIHRPRFRLRCDESRRVLTSYAAGAPTACYLLIPLEPVGDRVNPCRTDATTINSALIKTMNTTVSNVHHLYRQSQNYESRSRI